MGNKELALAIENTGIQKALKLRQFLLLNNSSTHIPKQPITLTQGFAPK